MIKVTREEQVPRISIYYDPDPPNPVEDYDCDYGVMRCAHRKYNLGHEQGTDAEGIPEDAIVLPLFLYDHSGLAISTTPFPCRWDSGQLGVIYCTMERIREIQMIPEGEPIPQEILDKVPEWLKQEVELYNKFLSGQAYGFVLRDDEGEEEDSCWGFYSLDCILAHLESKWHAMAREAFDNVERL
jgi:hypothetical protein